MSWCTNSERSLICLLSVSTWILRGHGTRSWLLFTFALYFPRGLFASSFVFVLVHHTEWDVPSDFILVHQLGKGARDVWRGVLGGRRQGAGVSVHFGYRHLQ